MQLYARIHPFFPSQIPLPTHASSPPFPSPLPIEPRGKMKQLLRGSKLQSPLFPHPLPPLLYDLPPPPPPLVVGSRTQSCTTTTVPGYRCLKISLSYQPRLKHAIFPSVLCHRLISLFVCLLGRRLGPKSFSRSVAANRKRIERYTDTILFISLYNKKLFLLLDFLICYKKIMSLFILSSFTRLQGFTYYKLAIYEEMN